MCIYMVNMLYTLNYFTYVKGYVLSVSTGCPTTAQREAHWSLIWSPPCSESLNQSIFSMISQEIIYSGAPHYLFHFVSFAGMVSSSLILYFGMPKKSTPLSVSIHIYPQVTSSVCRFNSYLYTDSSWHIHSPSLSSLSDTGM